MHTVVRTGAKTRQWTFFCVPNNKVHPYTTFPHCEQYNLPTLDETPKDKIHTGAQYSRLHKTYALKQLLSTRGQSNNTPVRRPKLILLTAFETTLRKQMSHVNLESKVIPRISRLFAPQAQHHEEWHQHNRKHRTEIVYHRLRFLRVEPHVPLQTPGLIGANQSILVFVKFSDSNQSIVSYI